MKIPRWAQVLIGVGIVMVFLGIGAVIAISAYFAEHVDVIEATAANAEDEFAKVRQRFTGKPPLLQIKDGQRVVNQPTSPASSAESLNTLHVLAWDAREQKLANVSVPWWVVRMKSGPIRFSSYASGLDDDDLELRVEDIERRGPGIILELNHRRGDRVLLWAD